MTLRKKQLEAVRLVFEGRKNHSEIAKELKISERTLYNWKHDPEFNQAVIDLGNETLGSNVGKLMANMTRLAFRGRNDYVKLQATTYLLDKVGFGLRDQQQINESNERLRKLRAEADIASAKAEEYGNDDTDDNIVIVDKWGDEDESDD
jgi:transposase-like protein